MTALNLDAMTRTLKRHAHIVPDDDGKPGEARIACGGCGYPLGTMYEDPWEALARHQAWELTHKCPDAIVVTELEQAPSRAD